MTIFYNVGSGVRNVTELENKARPHINLYHGACINSSSRLGGRSHNISQILSFIDKIRHIFEKPNSNICRIFKGGGPRSEKLVT